MATVEPVGSQDGLAIDELRLMHLADTALPIGSLAHSFGLETLVDRGLLRVAELTDFLRGLLEEAGFVEAVFCREAWRIAGRGREVARDWVELNEKLSARKVARESRVGSASLGRNFLSLVVALGYSEESGGNVEEGKEKRLTPQGPSRLRVNASYRLDVVCEALQAARESGALIHHCAAFGLACGALGIAEGRTVAAYLHQTIANLISASQRLMPLGQSAAAKILWELKPKMLEVTARSAECAVDDSSSFMPIFEWGAMEHPALRTRLFIS